jgi:hypothetical protein
MHYMIHVEREHAIIKASSPVFCHIIVGASFLSYLAVGLSIISPDVECRVIPLLMSFVFMIIFGSLFSKVCYCYLLALLFLLFFSHFLFCVCCVFASLPDLSSSQDF